MKLYNLGKVPWHESQIIYHALEALGREALSLVSPAAPYVCIGFHQDVEQEVDLQFCKANNILVFRRELREEASVWDEAAILLRQFYSKEDIETPGIEIDDWMKALEVGV
jgi:lipoate-protein ligase A